MGTCATVGAAAGEKVLLRAMVDIHVLLGLAAGVGSTLDDWKAPRFAARTCVLRPGTAITHDKANNRGGGVSEEAAEKRQRHRHRHQHRYMHRNNSRNNMTHPGAWSIRRFAKAIDTDTTALNMSHAFEVTSADMRKEPNAVLIQPSAMSDVNFTP